MNQYIEKIKEIESIKNTRYYTEFVEGFERIKDWAESEEMYDKAKLAQYEIEICSLHQENPVISVNKKESRFNPMVVYPNGMEWPDINQFTDEHFKYYEKRLIETENVFLKVRYSDFLFEYDNNKISKNKYEISQYLLSGLLEIINYYYRTGENYQYISAVARLVEVSLSMGDEEKIKKAVLLIFERLIEWNHKMEYRWTLELSEILRMVLSSKFKEIVLHESPAFIIEVLENARKEYLEEKEYNLYRIFCEELIEYSKLNLISLEEKNKLQLEIGRSYELESENQPRGHNNSLLIKAHFLELAMRHYVNIGEKELINDMKILIKQTYEQYAQSDEMITISMPLEIPSDIIDSVVSRYISSNIQTTLDKLSYSNEFIPKVSEIEKQVINNEEEFPFYALISRGIISDGKKVDHTFTDGDSENINFVSNYMLNLNINLEILIKKVFEKMTREFQLNADDIMEKFDRWGGLDNRNHLFVENGISKFFKDDYVGSIHILVPQFESALRRFFANMGFPTTSIKKGTAQHEETFNVFLNREDIKEFLGENIHRLIQIVMVEQSGLNLRNEIAHGLIKYSDITKSKCILVIYLFLILTRYNVACK